MNLHPQFAAELQFNTEPQFTDNQPQFREQRPALSQQPFPEPAQRQPATTRRTITEFRTGQ